MIPPCLYLGGAMPVLVWTYRGKTRVFVYPSRGLQMKSITKPVNPTTGKGGKVVKK
jgi:hypothetical protein